MSCILDGDNRVTRKLISLLMFLLFNKYVRLLNVFFPCLSRIKLMEIEKK